MHACVLYNSIYSHKFSLKWPNMQFCGHMGQNNQNWKNNRNATSQANWGIW